jgi:hypothetical protein
VSKEHAPERSKPNLGRLLSVKTVAALNDESVNNVWRKIKNGVYHLVYIDDVTPRITGEEYEEVKQKAIEQAIEDRAAGKQRNSRTAAANAKTRAKVAASRRTAEASSDP